MDASDIESIPSSELALQALHLVFDVRLPKEDLVQYKEMLMYLETMCADHHLVFWTNEEEGLIRAYATTDLEPEMDNYFMIGGHHFR